jgi:hypothetical protein
MAGRSGAVARDSWWLAEAAPVLRRLAGLLMYASLLAFWTASAEEKAFIWTADDPELPLYAIPVN